jgi:galactan 5-O-arabinofuranosyltransferase
MITIAGAGENAVRAEAAGPAEARPRVAALLWQLPLSAVVGGFVSLAVQRVLSRVDIPTDSFVPEAAMNLTCVLLLAALFGLVVLPRWTPVSTAATWTCLSALGTIPLGLLLRGSRFYLNGLSGDQLFRTQYLTRLAGSAALSDPNYAGLPPFYPAGWFWLGARFAHVVGLPAWAAYKPWAIVTTAVAPVLAFVLWSAVVRRPTAVVLAVSCCLVGTGAAAYEPYSWVLVAIVVPVAVLLWRDLRSWAVQPSGIAWSSVVLAGLCLGLCAAFYTLLALYFAAVIGVLVAWAGFLAVRDSAAGLRGRSVLLALAQLGVAGAAAIPLAALVWTPYLVQRVQHPAAPNPAARFLPHAGATIPAPMLELSVSGLICALGAVWILWSWRRDPIAQALGVLVVGVYLWYAASMLALLHDTTLLAFHAEPVLLTALSGAAGLAAVEITRWARGRIPRRSAEIARIAVAAGLGSMLVLVQNIQPSLEKYVAPGLVEQAAKTYDDSGKRPSGADPADAGAWNGQLLRTIDAMTRKPPRDVLMLTAAPDLLAFRPYHGFQVVSPAYANPLALYEQRRQLVDAWSRARDARELTTELDRSPFRPPSVFVLERGPNGLSTTASRDVFPKAPNAQPYAVEFPEKLFADPEFSRQDVGPYEVIVRN